MLEHTPKHGIAYPRPNSRVKDQNSTAKLASDMQANAFTTEQAIESIRWDHTATPFSGSDDIYGLPNGVYRPVSNGAARDAGLPTTTYGKLEVTTSGAQGKMLSWWPFSNNYYGFFTNRRVGSTNWTGWKYFAPESDGPDATTSGVEREMRVAQASARRGGTYGTDGKAVLSLVFDHGTNNFLSKIVPMLHEHNVPATLGLNSQMYDPNYMFHDSDNNTTWAQIQSAAIDHGFTIWNHGRRHTGGGFDEIVGGREDLEAALPEIPIDGWLHTGAYGDFQSGRTFAKYWEHQIGATIMNSHAYLTGDIQEPVKPLTGQLKPGFDGQWVDNGGSSLNTLKSHVEEAQKVAGGVMLRHHPMYLDEGGRITSAELENFIAWAAAERDAGRLLILTADLMNHADAGRSYRRNLLPGDGGSGNQTRSINLSRNALAKGSVNELHVIINVSQSGTVNLIAQCQGLDRTQQTTVPAGRSVVRMFFTIPLTSTGDLTVTVGQATHIGLVVEELNVYPG